MQLIEKRTPFINQTVRPFYSASMLSLITRIQPDRTTIKSCTYVESDYSRTRKLCSLYRYGIYRRKLQSYYVIDQSFRFAGEVLVRIETKSSFSLF